MTSVINNVDTGLTFYLYWRLPGVAHLHLWEVIFKSKPNMLTQNTFVRDNDSSTQQCPFMYWLCNHLLK